MGYVDLNDNIVVLKAFYNASIQGDIKEMNFLCSKGANINVKYKDKGDSPFYCAALEGNMDAMKILLRYGADINTKNDGGYTPLHAVIAQYHEAAQQNNKYDMNKFIDM